MASRQQYEEYWRHIDETVVNAKPQDANRIETRRNPEAALRMKVLEEQLRMVQEELGAATRAKAAVLHAKQTESEIEKLANGVVDKHRDAHRDLNRAGDRERRGRPDGKRAHFVRPHAEDRAAYHYHPSERERMERWGVSPILGGGQTLYKAAARQGQEAAMEKLERGLADRRLYHKDRSELQEAVRLYKQAAGGAM